MAKGGIAQDPDGHHPPGEDEQTDRDHRDHPGRQLPRPAAHARAQVRRPPDRPEQGALPAPLRHQPLLLPLPPRHVRHGRRRPRQVRHHGDPAQSGQPQPQLTGMSFPCTHTNTS